jgi:hypothetical protein
MPQPNPAVTLRPYHPDSQTLLSAVACSIKLRRAQEVAILLDANFLELCTGEVRRIPLLGTWVNKGSLPL